MTRDVSASKGTGTAEGTGNPRNTVDFDARRRLVEKRSAAALISEKFVRIGAIREESHESFLKRLKSVLLLKESVCNQFGTCWVLVAELGLVLPSPYIAQNPIAFQAMFWGEGRATETRVAVKYSRN